MIPNLIAQLLVCNFLICVLLSFSCFSCYDSTKYYCQWSVIENKSCRLLGQWKELKDSSKIQSRPVLRDKPLHHWSCDLLDTYCCEDIQTLRCISGATQWENWNLRSSFSNRTPEVKFQPCPWPLGLEEQHLNLFSIFPLCMLGVEIILNTNIEKCSLPFRWELNILSKEWGRTLKRLLVPWISLSHTQYPFRIKEAILNQYNSPGKFHLDRSALPDRKKININTSMLNTGA